MRQNELKRKLQRGETVFGPFMCYSGGSFVEIAGMAGFDFVIVDLEHGPISVETAEELCRAAQSTGVSPIVRVRKNDGPQIQRALDIGSAGVQVPQIETRADAEAVVKSAKYGPLGTRGLSFYTRAGDWAMHGVAGYAEHLNAEQLVVIHIEGQRGLQNLDEIISVPHIDVVFLGPYDLSNSFGVPGQVNDPRVIHGMEMAVARIRAAGKAAGTYAGDPATAQRWAKLGVQYVSLGVDVGIFADACTDLLRRTKAGL